MTQAHQGPNLTTREGALQLAVSVVLSKFRMLSAMTSSISCSAEPHSPVRLDSLHVVLEIEQTRNWLEVERCRIAAMPDSDGVVSSASPLPEGTYFPGEGGWSAPPIDPQAIGTPGEEAAS